MDESDLELCQQLIDEMPVGERKCLKEIFGPRWPSIPKPKIFGQEFKKAVVKQRLRNIVHIGIRNSGRCDEYERV
jgi:hypothetical protein